MKHLFREYDIRGLADKELTNEFALALGFCLGQKILQTGDESAYVGQDVRISSPRLADSLTEGLKTAGVKVVRIGEGPTPLLYFSASQPLKHHKTRSGIMVTGSHNPAEFNGFKMVIGGKTLFGSAIQEIQTGVLGRLNQGKPAAKPTHPSNDVEWVNRTSDYVGFVGGNIKLGRKVKVVLDAGNGAAGPLAIKVFEAIGCEVVPLYCNPDGRFPNHHPDPTVPKNLVDLIAAVKKSQSDLGIGFDGDGDRIGAVTSSGRILFGDQLILYLSQDILKDKPGASIISDVKSSQVLFDTLKLWGANPIMWKTGHSLIKAKLAETGAELAGEMSGHLFFKHRYLGFDDAIYAGTRLVESFSHRNQSLDQFLDSLPATFSTPEIRVDCPDDKKFTVVSRFVEFAKKKFGSSVVDLDGARISLSDGWGLVRASNTQPILVFRFESRSQDGLKNIHSIFEDLMSHIDDSIVVPMESP